MKILGLKYSHDAAVTLIDGDVLRFHVELEKINNNNRYTKGNHQMASQVLNMYGMGLDDVDQIVVDGWHNEKDSIGNDVAPYAGIDTDLTAPYYSKRYVSYPHILTHIMGAYVTSPWAKDREPAYCITWDGRQVPRIDWVNPGGVTPVKYVGLMFPLSGLIYGIMGYYFGPFKNEDVISGKSQHTRTTPLLYYYDIPGKLMSYIGLGKFDYDLYHTIQEIFNAVVHYASSIGIERLTKNRQGEVEHLFMKIVNVNVRRKRESMPDGELDDATVLNTIHMFLEQKLIDGIKSIIPKGSNLMFTGGSALNIKWNSAIARMNHVKNFWVPPFPNDCGNALGAAAAYAALSNDTWSIEWDVYSGPPLIHKSHLNMWKHCVMSPYDLGRFIATHPTSPVVVMHGNAEIGPRALGARSIIMSASEAENKVTLNRMKNREDFRPVAPIALLDDAREAFLLVTDDPYMLYDHRVCHSWQGIIPAVVHVDGTARVQTVSKAGPIQDLLLGYKSITGYGIVCNTSANEKGKGFFPDLVSAITWAERVGCNYIWFDGSLYTSPKLGK